MYACVRQETVRLNTNFKLFRFSEFFLTFTNVNSRARARGTTLSHIYPSQQYTHARSHPGGAMGEVSQSARYNVIKSSSAVREGCAEWLCERLGASVSAAHMVRDRKTRECADNSFIIGWRYDLWPLSGVGSFGSVVKKHTSWLRAFKIKPNPFLQMAMWLTLAASAGGVSNTSHLLGGSWACRVTLKLSHEQGRTLIPPLSTQAQWRCMRDRDDPVLETISSHGGEGPAFRFILFLTSLFIDELKTPQIFVLNHH